MSTKAIIFSLVGVIVIGSAIFFAMKGNMSVVVTTEPLPVQITKEETPNVGDSLAVEPTTNSTNDEIIDYLVDGQSHDETVVAKATIDSVAPAPFQEPITSTNF